MSRLNCQRHECTKSEDGVNHLLQFAVHEEDLEVTEDVYEIGAVVRVGYRTPSRDVSIMGTVKGFQFDLDHSDPYAACVLMLEELEVDGNV